MSEMDVRMIEAAIEAALREQTMQALADSGQENEEIKRLREAIKKAIDLIRQAESSSDWPGYAAGVDEARDVLSAALEVRK